MKHISVFVLLGVIVQSGMGQDNGVLTTIYPFGGSGTGVNPHGTLVSGPNGVLYGTAAGGGDSGNGTVFMLTPPSSPGGVWTGNTLYNFKGPPDGALPLAGLVLAPDGALYGTTFAGGTSAACAVFSGPGCGTAFMLKPPKVPGRAWTETILHNFTESPDGAHPSAGLVLGQNGVLYGTTTSGGASGNCPDYGCGAIFMLTPPSKARGPWSEAVLYSFAGSPNDGENPVGNLAVGTDGSLYGVSLAGGSCGGNGCGTVFRLVPPANPGGGWTEDLLYGVSSVYDTGRPSGVTIGPNGFLYVTAYSGLFELVPPTIPTGIWTRNVLHIFDFAGGYDPLDAVAIGGNGVLYGTTYLGGVRCDPKFPRHSCGTVFELRPPGIPGGQWKETVLHAFAGNGDGSGPSGGLVIATNGVIYGTTQHDLGNHGGGTAFELQP